MSDQGTLDLFEPAVRPVSDPPVRIPHQSGSHSSWTGAQAQTLKLWTEKQSALLQMIDNGQPLTRNQLAVFLHWPLSSVCSILNSVRDKLEVVDYESYDWGGGRITKRERFRIRK
jgi:hypothetical protein